MSFLAFFATRMEFVEKYWVYCLGFFAQALFGTRLIAQLIISEKKGQVVSPAIYWQLGVVGSFLFMIYGIIRNDFVIIFGQSLSYFIYIRNLQLKNLWTIIPLPVRIILFSLPVFAVIYIFSESEKLNAIFSGSNISDPIVAIGAVGQLMLNLRYVYQWIYSEKKNESVLPVGFWIISATASAMIISYSWFRNDPVLLVSQGLGIFIYVRNIIIHFRPRKVEASA
jgi:lipid-A-disaccharide synthase-like uncharacterized protein